MFGQILAFSTIILACGVGSCFILGSQSERCVTTQYPKGWPQQVCPSHAKYRKQQTDKMVMNNAENREEGAAAADRPYIFIWRATAPLPLTFQRIRYLKPYIINYSFVICYVPGYAS